MSLEGSFAVRFGVEWSGAGLVEYTIEGGGGGEVGVRRGGTCHAMLC